MCFSHCDQIFFLTQMNVTLNWSTSTSSVLFLLSCNHAWNFFLLTIFSLNVCLPNLTHHWRLGSNNSHFRGFYFIPSQSRCATFFFWPISVASIVFYLDLFCGIYSYIYIKFYLCDKYSCSYLCCISLWIFSNKQQKHIVDICKSWLNSI